MWAQAALREGLGGFGWARGGWFLTYPEIFLDAGAGGARCSISEFAGRFSDCTTGSAEWIAFGLLSAGWSLQDVLGGGAVGGGGKLSVELGFTKSRPP